MLYGIIFIFCEAWQLQHYFFEKRLSFFRYVPNKINLAYPDFKLFIWEKSLKKTPKSLIFYLNFEVL